MDRIQTDSGMHFTAKGFQEGFSVHAVRLSLVPSYHLDIIGPIELTRPTLQTIAHSIILHALVSDKYIKISLIYTTHHLFIVIPIKHLVNQDGEPTAPHKLATGTKPSVSNIRVLSFPCVVRKETPHVYTKALNMRHQPQKKFMVCSLELKTSKRVPHLCTYSP